MCNKKVSKEIMNEFSINIPKYSNLVANNKGLVEWIITISRESKYKLKITVNDHGIFFIDGKRVNTVSNDNNYNNFMHIIDGILNQ